MNIIIRVKFKARVKNACKIRANLRNQEIAVRELLHFFGYWHFRATPSLRISMYFCGIVGLNMRKHFVYSLALGARHTHNYIRTV